MSTFRHAQKSLALAIFALIPGAIYAQSSIVVSPTQLTFNTQSGTASPQNLVIFSNGAAASFTATTSSSGNWLTVTPTSGTSPQVLSVSVNSAALSMGSYGGFVTITSGGATTTVPVTLNVNTSGTSPLTATPANLVFSFAQNSSVPQGQQVNVTGTSSTSFTATTSTSTGGTWLSVNPSASSTPSTLSVIVNPTGLNAGIYYGSIALNPPGTTGLVIPVQVNVATQSALTIAPQQLSFAYQLGTSTPAQQSLVLTTTGTSAISFTANATTTNCGTGWLVVSPQSSATPSTLSVQINPTGLQSGNCSGTINISAPGASNPTQSIPVSLLVSNNPLLQVPTSGVTFNYQLGTATPASQTVQVTSSSTALPFTVAATPVSNGPNFLTVSPISGTTPQAVTLSLNTSVLSGLAPNTYAENVTVTSTGAGNPSQTFVVTLNVSNTPTLLSTQQAVNFNYQIGQATPQNQTVTLSSNGAPLSYSVTATATTCPGFLSATPASGTTAFQSGQQSQIVVGVTTTGLTTPQTCTGTITITSPGSTAAPVTIPATLTVSSTPLINLSPAAINVVALPNSAAMQQTIALTSTDSATALNFSAVAVTNPAGLTWLSVAPNAGTSPASLSVTINPLGLPPGIYTGSISVTSTSTGVPAQTVPVTLTVATGTISAAPTTITFSQPVGGPVPAAQTVQIAGVPAGATVGATTTLFNGSSWLTATASGNTITLTPAGSQLAAGTYSGVITVFVPGAVNSPFYLPVTYTVGGSGGIFIPTPATLSFTYQAGATVPPAQTIQLTANGVNPSISFNATAVAPPGTAGGGILFMTVSPATGTSPASLTVSLNSSIISTLAAGTYTDNILLTTVGSASAMQTIPVTLTVTAAGMPTVTAVISGATFQTGAIAPGELVSIFGSNIGPAQPVGTTLTPSGNVSTSIGNVTVTFNGIAAPLTYASANQINAVVPWEIGGVTSATVVVTNNGTAAANFQVSVINAAPGIFAATMNGSGQGAIVNADGTVNSATNPAARGSGVAIYATGGGALTPAGVTGSVTGFTPPLPTTSQPVTVTIGGVAAQVTYAGGAPGLVSGVLQINVNVPTTVLTGNAPVVVTVGGTSSPAVATIAVK